MESLFRDVRYATRNLSKRPGFTAIAVIILTLGIGANTAIFSVVNGVLLRQLSYPFAERIVTVWSSARNGRTWGLTGPEFFDFRELNHSFEHFAVYQTGGANLTGGDQPLRITIAPSSAGLFDVLGVKPEMGRVYLAEDDQPGHDGVIVMSHALWRQEFGADPEIVGKQVAIDGVKRSVIGVMPASFTFPNDNVQAWMPLALDRATVDAGDRSYNAIGRLKDGVSLEYAQSEMTMIARRLIEEYARRYPKGANTTSGVNLVPLHELMVGETKSALLMLSVGVLFVLAISCSNVSSLLFTRALSRRREIALRMALGATRGHIVRQLLIEALLLALVGGALGLLLATWGVDALLALGPANLPRVEDIAVDRHALTFTLVLSLLSGALSGLIPALQFSKPNLTSALKDGARGSFGARIHSTRSFLVTVQMALALVLLIGAGLMIRSFSSLLHVNLGFNPENVVTARLSLPDATYSAHQRVTGFYQQLIERVEALPGVTAAGVVNRLPLSGLNSNASFGIPGSPEDPGQNADYRIVSTDYFRALEIPLLLGRQFSAADNEYAPPAIIVNQTFARQFFAGENPLEKRLTLGVPAGMSLTIVGVVGDVKHENVNTRARPEMYFPRAQATYATALSSWPSMTLVVRTSSDPGSIAGPLADVVRNLDKDLPAPKIVTMKQLVSTSIADSRFSMLLLLVLALIALALASVGIYGVMSQTVAERIQEIGIRMALGARAFDVLKLIVRNGLKVTVVGIAIGLSGAFALTRLMRSLLFGVSPTDVITFTAVSGLLILVALLACYFPARRATKIDPLVALRYE